MRCSTSTASAAPVLEARIRVLVRLLDEILDHPDVRDALYTDIQDLIDRAVESLIVRERG